MGWTSTSYYNATTASFYYNGINTSPSHAVVIVGWDDNYFADNFATTSQGNGASSSRTAGAKIGAAIGYFYIPYYDSMFGRMDLSAVFDNAESTNNYSGSTSTTPWASTEHTGSLPAPGGSPMSSPPRRPLR